MEILKLYAPRNAKGGNLMTSGPTYTPIATQTVTGSTATTVVFSSIP